MAKNIVNTYMRIYVDIHYMKMFLYFKFYVNWHKINRVMAIYIFYPFHLIPPRFILKSHITLKPRIWDMPADMWVLDPSRHMWKYHRWHHKGLKLAKNVCCSQASSIFQGKPKFITTTQNISSKLEIKMITLFY